MTSQRARIRAGKSRPAIEALRQPAEPVAVEIVAEDGAFYLLRMSEDGRVLADTWHLTVDEAREQARYEFGVRLDEWEGSPPE